MNKKICINKKVFLIIGFILVIFFLSVLTNNIIKSKTSYKSEAAPAAIYGGTEVTDPKKWPFIARIYKYKKGNVMISEYGICDGTLIAPRWILTAEHCTIDQKTDKVFIGSNNVKDINKNTYNIKKFIKNPNYVCFNSDCKHFTNDIALIELQNEVKGVDTISLNGLSAFQTEGEGVMEVIIGWGWIENLQYTDILRQAVLPVLSNERVNRKDWTNNTILPSEIAAGYPKGGTGFCEGDSGGPGLVWDGNKWIQISINAWKPIKSRELCGEVKQPSIGTRLSYSGIQNGKSINYLQWIKDTIKKETGEIYTGIGTFKGNDLTYPEKTEFIRRIWINRELEADSLQPH